MFLIFLPTSFLGATSLFLLFFIGKVGTNKNQQFMPQKVIPAKEKKHGSFQAGSIIKRSIS